MEGDGDLMKMLMHADPPDENIPGPMEDTAMVQTGVWVKHLLLILDDQSFLACWQRAHVRQPEQYDLWWF